MSKSLTEIRKSFVSAPRVGRTHLPLMDFNKKTGQYAKNPSRINQLKQRMEYDKKVPQVIGDASKNKRAMYDQSRAEAMAERGMRSHSASERRAQAWRQRMGKPEPTRAQRQKMAPHVQQGRQRGVPQNQGEATATRWQHHQREEARQVAQARREAEQAKAAKRAAKQAEKGYRKNMHEAYNNVHFTTNQKRTVAAGTAATVAGTGGVVALNRPKEKVGKADDGEKGRIARDAAIGVGAGTGAAYALDHAGGYAWKKTMARRRRDALINDKGYRKKYDKHWNAFKQKKGFDTIAGKTGFENSKIMRDYPKKLKDWKGQRAMAWQSSKRGQALTFGGAAVGGAALAARHGYKKRQEQSGPVMKSEAAGHGVMEERFAKARPLITGTNVSGYGYANLPDNIREQVGAGAIRPRRNPMSALDLFSATRTMTEAAARANGDRISRRRLTARAHNEMKYAGSRAMLYSPVGRGSTFS